MKRKDFIQTMFAIGGMSALSSSFAGCSLLGDRSICFGISADIHKDIMPDADSRLTTFVKTAEMRNANFLVDLGDFCMCKPTNKEFLSIWQNSKVPTYNVLGNHDMDYLTKEDQMSFVGMKNRYYSFDQGEIHFIVLDPNNLHIEGQYIPYQNANFYKPSEQRAYVDPKQLSWLEQDLSQTDKPTIVFSHQSFENPKACSNQDKVRGIFENANHKAGFTKVVAAFSGHDHTNFAKEINGIQYIQINSMSNQWVGGKYTCLTRFTPELNEEYKSVRYTTPYNDPIFAFVTIDKHGMKIEGVQSTFMSPTPKDLGIPGGGLPMEAKISNREFKFD